MKPRHLSFKTMSGVVALVLASSATLAACGSDGGSSSGSGDSIVIGSVHPLTGALAGAGGLMDDGAKLAVEDINKAGGIKSLGGAKLKLDEGDSQGLPRRARARRSG